MNPRNTNRNLYFHVLFIRFRISDPNTIPQYTLLCSLLAFDELARELEKRESQLMEMRKTLSHSVMRDVRRIAQDCDGEKLRDFYEKLYELDNANRWASLSKHDRQHFREALLAACDAAYRLSTSEELARVTELEDGFWRRHTARLMKAKAGAN